MKTARIVLVLLLGAYSAINLYAYSIQSQLMYFPALERLSPKQVGLDNVEEVTLVTDSGISLTSWYGRASAGKPTILFFHGNGGAVYHRDYRFRDFMAEGYGVFILGYPGYGGNDGRPSELSFQEGASLSYDYLRNQGLGSDEIVIYGESIGSGVAVHLAANVQARGLVLEAPMSSTVDVAREHYPFLLANRFLTDKFQSINRIGDIDMPLLVIHGDRDQVIPISIGRKLFEQARDPKTFITVEGANHNNLRSYSVHQIALEFVDAL